MLDPTLTPSEAVVLLRRRGVSESLSADFWTATLLWMKNDTLIASLFPGGIINFSAGSAQEYPYARLAEFDIEDPDTADDWQFKATISCYANSDDEAKRRCNLFLRRLDDTPNRTRITFGDWMEAGHMSVGKIDLVRLSPTNDGLDVWRADLEFKFLVVAISPQTLYT